ncbi:MAG TPA: succinate CoA transferase [Anaeromyxobacteraceae bacterium]|nr:succinate CoA transferase [Anaeromyxobacteraceae bacterium]
MSILPCPELTAEEAAELVEHGQSVGFSGFTAAGAAKAIPRAIAARAKAEHAAGRPFAIGVLTGASTCRSLDGALAKAEAVRFRTPYQSDPLLRSQINSGNVRFFDMHLSVLPQHVRYGFLGPVHWAIIEACELTRSGGIVLTTSVGATPTFCREAERLLIELNAAHSPNLLGMHDLFEPMDPPTRQEIPIYRPADRIGSPILVVDPSRIAGVVMTNEADETEAFSEPTGDTRRIGENVAEFLVAEMRVGRIPPGFLPLQSGVGDIANSALSALGAHPDIPSFEMYTEVVQDSVVQLLDEGLCQFASTCSLTFSPETGRRVMQNAAFYRDKLLMRPQEISNHPEIVRRLGIISMNTAIEIDLLGNVNSTHIMGQQIMNGIGGSGDFTRNAYLSVFSCPSTAKGGKISTIVPHVSHVDHSEHSVQVVATEQGVADLRGKDPRERAELIIAKCAHPDYRDVLREYVRLSQGGHAPHSLSRAFAMHRQFLGGGDMRKIRWAEWE